MLVLCGYSGSGKDTLQKELINRGYEKIITYTTRPMRDGETNDKDYHFISQKKFNKLKEEGFFAETASYNASFGFCSYGSAKEDYEDNNDNKKIIILNPYGLKALQEQNIPHYSVYLDVDKNLLQKRLKGRGDSKEEILRRLEADERDFSDLHTDLTFKITEDMSVYDIADTLEDILDMNMEMEY